MMTCTVSELPCHRWDACRCCHLRTWQERFQSSWLRSSFRGVASHVFLTLGQVPRARAISDSVGCGEVLISARHAALRAHSTHCFSLSIYCACAGTKKISRKQRPSHQGVRASRLAPTGGWEAWYFLQPSALES